MITIPIVIPIVVGSILLLWLIGNLMTTVFQDHFIFWPAKLPQDHVFQFQTDFEELWLEMEDGGRIHGLLFRSGPAPKGVVVYCHGNAGHLERWGALYPVFRERGWDLLIWDYRGFGKSRGRRTEASMLADGWAMYRWASERYGTARTLVYGRSMGSAPASYIASRASDLPHLILETPFSGMQELFFTYYPFFPKWLFTFKYRFPNRQRLHKARCPITIFHGTRDLTVPLRNAERLRPVLKPGDRFIVLTGAGHNDCSLRDEYRLAMDEILDTLPENSAAGKAQ